MRSLIKLAILLLHAHERSMKNLKFLHYCPILIFAKCFLFVGLQHNLSLKVYGIDMIEKKIIRSKNLKPLEQVHMKLV